MEELDFSNPNAYFDFKSFLNRILSNWYVFLIFIGLGLGLAYYVSVRKLPIYKMSSLISINEDSNPLFTNSNTSLTFNWGGQSSKMGSIMTTLQTRTHNERVVKHLQYYLQYLKQGKYQLEDAYGSTPFVIKVNENEDQLQGQTMAIQILNEKEFEVSFTIEDEPKQLKYYNYKTEKFRYETFDVGTYKDRLPIGNPFVGKYFSGILNLTDISPNQETAYFISFLDFNQVVKQYQSINVSLNNMSGSVMNLQLVGENKNKLVDYLNTTTVILSNTLLDQKNLFATKTIRFIDSTLADKAIELEAVEDEINSYKLKNNIIDLNGETQQLKQRLMRLDEQKKAFNRQIDYLNSLNNYLLSRNTYEDPPAPSIAGIEEGSLVDGVRKIVELSIERNKYEYTAKPNLPKFKDIDRQIDATKSVLQETIESSKANIFREIELVNKDLREAERQVQKLPENQQGLLKIERRFNISQQTYDLFLSKKNEAKLIKASNVSDIQIIDEAKDVGGGQVGPNNKLNYVMAVLFGFGIPLTYIFFVVYLDNKINNTKDIEKQTDLPLIAVIGKSRAKKDTVVLDQPNSVISESFRGLRTSLQFMFRETDRKKSKCILITSSVGGEGKTFNAINVASVMALSDKKTLIIGLDLRKPKLHRSFDVERDVGISNFISGQAEYTDIIQETEHKNLYVITSGTVPPNPSEILLDDKMDLLIDKLKKEFDIIVMDTPPIGLVSDALNLMRYCDTSLYVVKQHFTKKGMLNFINQKYKKGEVRDISLILNYFKAKQKSDYGYGYGYEYGYASYGKGYLKQEKTSLFQKLKNIFK
jgi:capsular exopolysaccharide synthesis family protein